MGTRAYITIRYNGKIYKFYNHCDGGYYCLGLNLINDLIEYFNQDSSLENIKMEVSKIVLVNELKEKSPDDWSEYEKEVILNNLKESHEITDEELMNLSSEDKIKEAGYDIDFFMAIKNKNLEYLIEKELHILSGDEIYFGSGRLDTYSGGYKYIFEYLAKHNYIYDEENSCALVDEYDYILDLDNLKFGFRNFYEKTGLDLPINEKNLKFIKELFGSDLN
jgi:hypothetical protein